MPRRGFIEFLQERADPANLFTPEEIAALREQYLHIQSIGQRSGGTTDTENTPHISKVQRTDTGARATRREATQERTTTRRTLFNNPMTLENAPEPAPANNTDTDAPMALTAAADGGEGGDYQTPILRNLKPAGKPWKDVVTAYCPGHMWFSVQGQTRYNDLYKQGSEPTPSNTGPVHGTCVYTLKLTDPWRPFNYMANNKYLSVANTTRGNGAAYFKGISYDKLAGNLWERHGISTTMDNIDISGRALYDGHNPYVPRMNITSDTEPDPSSRTIRWFDYYRNFYMNYTIIGVKWKLTIDVPKTNIRSTTPAINTMIAPDTGVCAYHGAADPDSRPSANHNHVKRHGKLFWWYEQTSTDNDVSGTNIPSNETTNLQQWAGLKGHLDMHEGGHYVIEDTWHFGKYQHNAINDKDIQTWAICNAPGTSNNIAPGYQGANGYMETVRFSFKRGDWDTQRDNTIEPGLPCNCKMDVEYILQFRDLKRNIMWIPEVDNGFVNNAANTDIDMTLTYPTVIQRVP